MALSEFDTIVKIGDGAFSSVYKVRRKKDGLFYALKQVSVQRLSAKDRSNALNEVRLLASLRHANVIAYKEAFVDLESEMLWCISDSLVMEYADGGDLAQELQQRRGVYFDEEALWKILVQLLRGLCALHDLHIVHRDLKAANVFLFKDGTVKLGDLNVAEVAKRGPLSSQAGTPYYASPEVWRELPCDEKSDIWSLGCVIYEAAALRIPFHAQNMEVLKRKITQGLYQPLPGHLSNDFQSVVAAMLQLDPAQRPSCDQMLAMPSVYQRFAYSRTRAHDSALLGTIYGHSFLQAKDHLPASRYSEQSPERLPHLPSTIQRDIPDTWQPRRIEHRRPSNLLRSRHVTPDFLPQAKDNTANVDRDHSAGPIRNKLISDCCDQIIGSYERSRVVFNLLRSPYPARKSYLS